MSIRHFQVICIIKRAQKKKQTHHRSGYYKGTPGRAALKAFNSHCREKGIRGSCALTVVIQEITRGSLKKKFAYKAMRKKVNKKVERDGKIITFKYEAKIKSTTVPGYCSSKKKKK
jgi:hypothetical protein